MSVCYFGTNYEESFKCDYEFKDDIIEVEVEYDIDDEVEEINGVKSFGINIEFNKRDIFIVDYINKKNYLVKKAYYLGHRSIYGSPDGGTKTKFRSFIYFEHNEIEILVKLPKTPKLNKIKVFSNAIGDLIKHPSLAYTRSDEEFAIHLSKEKNEKCIEVKSNNIRNIIVAEEWSFLHKIYKHNITIEFNGYIEIELINRVNYDLVPEYIYELVLFMQLYYPDKFCIDKIDVMVNSHYYRLCIPKVDFKYKDRYVERTIKEGLLDFLKKCYLTIPYRNSKTEIRNIPYIIMKTSRCIEDNFLLFYRFIECYYKKQPIENIKKLFVSYSIREHYMRKNGLSEDAVEKYVQEIICLRNHYVHSGYYIRNSCLKVSFDRINKKKNEKDYTVNIDIKWIYDRTKILYLIAIDIIFFKILGYTDYNFENDFERK